MLFPRPRRATISFRKEKAPRRYCFRRYFRVRALTSLAVLAALLLGSVPPAVASSLLRAAITQGAWVIHNASVRKGVDTAGPLKARGVGVAAGTTYMTYDVDSGWPAQGFRLGYGQIEDQGSAGFTLTDADGTRHALVHGTGYNYDTTDGTFIHYYGGSGSGDLYYPDGTVVTYGAGGSGSNVQRIYPTKVMDRNGNYISIGYAGTNGAGPQIDSITDTLNRHVIFHYASNGDLVTITAPGLTGYSALQVKCG